MRFKLPSVGYLFIPLTLIGLAILFIMKWVSLAPRTDTAIDTGETLQQQNARLQKQHASRFRVMTSEIKARPTSVRISNATCLNLFELPPPWIQDEFDQSLSYKVSAPGSLIGVVPFERENFDRSFGGVPHDGRVRLALASYVIENDFLDGEAFNKRDAEAAKIKGRTAQHIKRGFYKPLDLWPNNSLGLKAYEISARDRTYLDDRGLTSCRDRDSRIFCTVISEDESYRFSVILSGEERDTLPSALQKISFALEKSKGDCSLGPVVQPDSTISN
jgi:hypothetical protein